MNSIHLTISVVSHGQIHLVTHLLHDIDTHCRSIPLEVILTLNVEETLPFEADSFSFQMQVVRNHSPQGFSTNHNQAFSLITGRFFCVMNPDIRFDKDPFPPLLSCLQSQQIGVAAPVVVSENGLMEDNARHFPTPFKILCKVFSKRRGSDYVIKTETIYPDWVGGMFMLFRNEVFKQMGGFNQKYFLYYEDVDLCARIRLQGYEVALCPGATVVHEARRDSHRKVTFFSWHLRSMMRFFLSSVYWQLQFRKYF